MVIIGAGQWVDAVDHIYGDPVELAERPKLARATTSDSNQRAEGKVPLIHPKEIGIFPETIAAREADLDHIGLAAEQQKQKEKNHGPHPINEDLIKQIFGNLMSVHQHHRAEAVKKGETITVPLPRLEDFLPQRQQYPTAPPSSPDPTSGTVVNNTGKEKGKATDDEEK